MHSSPSGLFGRPLKLHKPGEQQANSRNGQHAPLLHDVDGSISWNGHNMSGNGNSISWKKNGDSISSTVLMSFSTRLGVTMVALMSCVAENVVSDSRPPSSSTSRPLQHALYQNPVSMHIPGNTGECWANVPRLMKGKERAVAALRPASGMDGRVAIKRVETSPRLRCSHDVTGLTERLSPDCCCSRCCRRGP